MWIRVNRYVPKTQENKARTVWTALWTCCWRSYMCACLAYCGPQGRYVHDYLTGTGAIVWLPQCQWDKRELAAIMDHNKSNPEEYGYIYLVNSHKLVTEPLDTPTKQHIYEQRTTSLVHILWDMMQVHGQILYNQTQLCCFCYYMTNHNYVMQTFVFSWMAALVNVTIDWVSIRSISA